MWQWNREIMADRFNEVFLDVILNCNYSALLSAWLYTHVCAAPNIPAELEWSRLRPLARELPISTWPNLEPGRLLCSRGYIVSVKNWTREETPNLPVTVEILWLSTLYRLLVEGQNSQRQELFLPGKKIFSILVIEYANICKCVFS